MVERIRLTGITENSGVDLRGSAHYADEPPIRRYSRHQDQEWSRWAFLGAVTITALWYTYWLVFWIGAQSVPGSSGIDFLTGVFLVIGPGFLWLGVLIFLKVFEYMSTSQELSLAARQSRAPERPARYAMAPERRPAPPAPQDGFTASPIDYGDGLERALDRLASAETLINDHASRIEEAALIVEERAAAASEKIIGERDRLNELGDALGAQADGIAEIISGKSKMVLDASQTAEQQLQRVEQDLAQRITDLRTATDTALEGCKLLGDELHARTSQLDASASEVALRASEALAKFDEKCGDLTEASATLSSENQRLEASIAGQRDMVDRVVASFTEQADKIKNATDVGAHALETAARKAAESTGEAANTFTQHARQASQAGTEAAKSMRDAIEAARGAAEMAKSAAENAAGAFETKFGAAGDRAMESLKSVEDSLEARSTRLAERLEDSLRRAEHAGQQSFDAVERITAPQDTAPAAPAPTPQNLNDFPEDWGAPATAAPGAKPASKAKLDSMARQIAERRKREASPSATEAAPSKRRANKMSWSEILAAADRTPDPAGQGANKPAAAGPSFAEASERTIRTLQETSLELERRLFGEPARGAVNRFLAGERNLFAERLLTVDEAKIKSRIKSQAARDKSFADIAGGYLRDFDSLLEAASGERDAELVTQSLLASPIGNVYLLLKMAHDQVR